MKPFSKLPRWLLSIPLALCLHSGLHAETVARYGISMADIPLTTGQPDRGAGAYQFTGHTLYDPLVAWEANIFYPPGQAGGRSCHRLEARCKRSEKMELHIAPRRQVP